MSTEAQNAVVRDRRETWDIARGLAVLFMIVVHGMMVWGSSRASASALGVMTDFLGGPPAAPVFLFLMGAGTAVSRRTTPALLAKRGSLLLLGNYALNLARSVLPAFASRILGIGASRDAFLALTGGDGALGFLGVDILACAGLALLLIAGLEALRAPVWALPTLGIILNAAGSLLTGVDLPPVARAFGALAWGTAGYSFFPFLTWAIYPLAGAAWVRTVADTEPQPHRYGRILLVAAAVLAAVSLPYVLGLRDLFPTEASYYHHGPIEALWTMAFTITWIAFLGWLGALLPRVVRRTLTALSRSVTSVYVLHWIGIGWLALAVLPESLGAYGWLIPTAGLCAAAVVYSLVRAR